MATTDVAAASTDVQSGAGSTGDGVSRSLSDVTVQELMALPANPARPTWQVTRYPVSIEEFEELNRAAEEYDESDEAAPEALEDTAAEQDEAVEAAAVEEFDPPEGTALAGPGELAPNQMANFEGLTATAWQPPDCTVAVGPNDVLVGVNTDVAGYNKAGGQKFKWLNTSALFAPVLPAGAGIFDPKMVYDHYAGRWIVVVAARRQSPAGSWVLIAASQGANPGGAWWVWSLDSSLDGSNHTNNWGDFPNLGFDTQAVYITLNMFQIGGGFQYVKVRILSKAQLYAGGGLAWYDYWNLKNPDGSLVFTLQPAVHFRGLGGNPPAYLVNGLFGAGSSLTLWTLSDPLGYWSGRSASLTRRSIPCLSYDLGPNAAQPGTATRIRTDDNRLLNAVFQNVGGVQRLWTTHTTKQSWAGDSEARSALQWYEIDVPTQAVVQQNRFGRSGLYYYYPAIQTDISRNAHVVFGRSGSNVFAELRQTGRKVGDAPNTLEGSALVKAGQSAYTGGRWGDYSGICRDGGDSSVVWMYGQYAGASNTWATRVCATKF
jgi:hypothetical protein